MEDIKRVLVICPFSVVGVWEEEIAKHQPDGIKLEWRIVNYESVYARRHFGRSWIAMPDRELARYKAELVIVDESHNIGNPTTVVSKHACILSRQAKFRLIMTGTMFHRKPFYVFGQAKFYDPSIFGDTWTGFKKRYAIFGGFGGYEVKRYINLRELVGKMKPWVYIEKYVPPRDTAVNVLPFKLTGKNLEHYKTMEKHSIIDVGGEQVVSPIILSRHLRCQQIAGGWVKTSRGYRRVGTDKARMFDDRVREYSEQGIDKFVVGCRFVPELRDVATTVAKHGYKPILFHGGITDRKERDRRRRLFQDFKGKACFVAQLQTAKEGIDLSAADTMLFYSLSESYVVHDQFSRRIEKFRDTRVLQYDYLIAKGTRDEVTFAALQLKKDVAELIADEPELVEQITSQLE